MNNDCDRNPLRTLHMTSLRSTVFSTLHCLSHSPLPFALSTVSSPSPLFLPPLHSPLPFALSTAFPPLHCLSPSPLPFPLSTAFPPLHCLSHSPLFLPPLPSPLPTGHCFFTLDLDKTPKYLYNKSATIQYKGLLYVCHHHLPCPLGAKNIKNCDIL